MQVIFLYYWSDLHNGFRLPRPSLEGLATTTREDWILDFFRMDNGVVEEKRTGRDACSTMISFERKDEDRFGVWISLHIC